MMIKMTIAFVMIGSAAAGAQTRVREIGNVSTGGALLRIASRDDGSVTIVGTNGVFGVGCTGTPNAMREWVRASRATLDTAVRVAVGEVLELEGPEPSSCLMRFFRAAGPTGSRYTLQMWDGYHTNRIDAATSLTDAKRLLGLIATAADSTAAMTARRRPSDSVTLALPVDTPPASTSADVETPYFEFQVEKQAVGMPDNPRPRYPDMLRSAKVEGEVLAQFIVDTTGRAEMNTFKVLKSSHDLFTNSVRSALPSWRFYPAEIGNRRVRQLIQMPFVFGLNK